MFYGFCTLSWFHVNPIPSWGGGGQSDPHCKKGLRNSENRKRKLKKRLLIRCLQPPRLTKSPRFHLIYSDAPKTLLVLIKPLFNVLSFCWHIIVKNRSKSPFVIGLKSLQLIYCVRIVVSIEYRKQKFGLVKPKKRSQFSVIAS